MRAAKCTIATWGALRAWRTTDPSLAIHLWGVCTLTYHPNRLILEGAHRLIVEAFTRCPNRRLLLRPARKRLFAQEPSAPSLSVELSKPSFAALIDRSDTEAKPILVIETDPISAGVRELYRTSDIPFVEAEHSSGRGSFRFERPGFSAKLQFDDRGDSQAVESVLRWAESSGSPNRGPLVRNVIEKRVAASFSLFAEELGISTHHHMPFGYVAGYRQDLPRAIARHTIEMAISLRHEVDASMPVILPVRVDARRDDSSLDAEARDQEIAEYVCSVGMPMAAVQPADDGCFRLTYSLCSDAEVELAEEDSEGWTSALKWIIVHALGETRKSLSRS